MLKRYFLILSLFWLSVADAVVVDRIVAVVNEEIVTLSDIDSYKTRVQKGGMVDDALSHLRNTKDLGKDKSALLNYLIDEKILDSEVKKNNLTVTVERLEKEIRNITKRNNITRNQLKQALKEKGVAFSDYQDFVKTSIERQALVEREVSSKIKISDEDVTAYYMTHSPGGAAQIFEYTLAHILFVPQNGGEKAARDRAESVLKKINLFSFEKLAAEFSEDPNFNQNGILGTFKAGELSKELEAAVKPLPVGGTSQIVRTKAGFHILKVVKKVLVSDPRLEAEREKIRGILFEQTFKNLFRNWLDQKRQEAFIRINQDGRSS